MSIFLKPLQEQVLVVTGASSGIGLATAEAAVRAGASVVLVARSGDALAEIARRLEAEADALGRVATATCDVADRAQVDAAAQTAIDRFGRIDTWVNNAGVSIYGTMEETPLDDARRLFDTNVWGVFNGCQAAIPHLKVQGGALINVGSEVSDATIPMQGVYSASKHAVKGINDAFRIELEEVEKASVKVTLVQPTAVDTPYPQHARNLRDQEAKLPTPMIEATKVAHAILEAATSPTDVQKVGAMAHLNTALAKAVPSLFDKMAAMQFERQHTDLPAMHEQGALHRSSQENGVVGVIEGRGSDASKP
ncbi:SDR family oxidoreductase [Phycisphaera mikurensis]|uniref:Putative oxidoreductase n=1 Tax=Phycisphaera mikurensis (strain NBRC 102666 / KCTC 22515 / FYK2301M01) TaxID=1142394 RepID=I0IDG5_PHYMF|nr:SDR family oxidoreductase [Phycisphaera mikurensis]MBB6441123.1 NADP-dependent 3-hydroxy acid dehydrogenase YdfG [Phycisphaera mikurensis]BAM03303.1 putative oxidoreductase [Phycisphaera mikurensis NBRC 102666]